MEEDTEERFIVTNKDALKAVETIRKYLSYQKHAEEDFSNLLAIENRLDIVKSAASKQTKIDTFFQKS